MIYEGAQGRAAGSGFAPRIPAARALGYLSALWTVWAPSGHWAYAAST